MRGGPVFSWSCNTLLAFRGIIAAMAFAYYSNLSPARQRVYRESDEIPTLELPAGAEETAPVAAIRAGLLNEDRTAVQRACQALVDALVAGYGVPPVRVRVLAKRGESSI